MDLMIHRFKNAYIFGDSEEYEEHTDLAACVTRLKHLDIQLDGYSYWAEDAAGNVYNADDVDPCGYCGTSQNPNDMCITCFNNLT